MSVRFPKHIIVPVEVKTRISRIPDRESSTATHLLTDGYNIRTVQELLGYKDVRTTIIYTHVLNRGGQGVRSPADSLARPLLER